MRFFNAGLGLFVSFSIFVFLSVSAQAEVKCRSLDKFYGISDKASFKGIFSKCAIVEKNSFWDAATKKYLSVREIKSDISKKYNIGDCRTRALYAYCNTSVMAAIVLLARQKRNDEVKKLFKQFNEIWGKYGKKEGSDSVNRILSDKAMDDAKKDHMGSLSICMGSNTEGFVELAQMANNKCNE